MRSGSRLPDELTKCVRIPQPTSGDEISFRHNARSAGMKCYLSAMQSTFPKKQRCSRRNNRISSKRYGERRKRHLMVLPFQTRKGEVNRCEKWLRYVWLYH